MQFITLSKRSKECKQQNCKANKLDTFNYKQMKNVSLMGILFFWCFPKWFSVTQYSQLFGSLEYITKVVAQEYSWIKSTIGYLHFVGNSHKYVIITKEAKRGVPLPKSIQCQVRRLNFVSVKKKWKNCAKCTSTAWTFALSINFTINGIQLRRKPHENMILFCNHVQSVHGKKGNLSFCSNWLQITIMHKSITLSRKILNNIMKFKKFVWNQNVALVSRWKILINHTWLSISITFHWLSHSDLMKEVSSLHDRRNWCLYILKQSGIVSSPVFRHPSENFLSVHDLSGCVICSVRCGNFNICVSSSWYEKHGWTNVQNHKDHL